MQLEELETPALVLDINCFRKNMELMSSYLKGSRAKLRPHFKSNKCLEIVRAQLAAGAKGITCAKLGEAEVLAQAGVSDILIANQIVQPSKLARVAELARKCTITVCTDDAEQVDRLAAAVREAGSTVNVYVELEVGMKRCGISDFEEYYRLAKKITETPGLVYKGIQAYAGNVSHMPEQALRIEAVRLVEGRVKDLTEYLNARGIPVEEISGGSTATAERKAQDGVYTELQAGSYIFMDASYEKCGLDFSPALSVVTTVISTAGSAVIVDAGVKNFTMDQLPPEAVGMPCSRVGFSEEHTAFYGAKIPKKIGDKIVFLPGHCCTTLNTFDFLFVRDGNEIIAKWAIEGRGKSV